MSKDDFFAEKIFQMVEQGIALANPFGKLALADRDFLSFELAFFYFFIFDYKIFNSLDKELRSRIVAKFFKKIQENRRDDFKSISEIDPYYEKRIFSYFEITKKISNIGEFGGFCADYINTLLTFSQKKNVFTCYDFIQAEKELKPQIEPDKYTEELKVILTLTSSPLLADGIDPTDVIRTTAQNIFGDIEELNESDNASKNEVDSLLAQAELLSQKSRYDEAEEVYKAIIEKNPACCDAYYGLSLVYTSKEFEHDLKNKYLNERLALYKEVEKIDPYFDNFWVLAEYLDAAGKSEEALSYYDKSIQYDLNELTKNSSHVDWLCDAYEGKARILWRTQQYKEALECYDHAIAITRKKDGDARGCSELFAAKREIYCRLNNENMILRMDKEFAKAEDLWRAYKESGEYEKAIPDEGKGIAQSLDKEINIEKKLEKEMCRLVLLELKKYPRKGTGLINEAIDQLLEETDCDEATRYIKKACVARLVNEALYGKNCFLRLLKKFLNPLSCLPFGNKA